MKDWRHYTKALIAVLIDVLVFVQSVMDGGITESEAVTLAIVTLGAIGVYFFENKPKATAGQ